MFVSIWNDVFNNIWHCVGDRIHNYSDRWRPFSAYVDKKIHVDDTMTNPFEETMLMMCPKLQLRSKDTKMEEVDWPCTVVLWQENRIEELNKANNHSLVWLMTDCSHLLESKDVDLYDDENSYSLKDDVENEDEPFYYFRSMMLMKMMMGVLDKLLMRLHKQQLMTLCSRLKSNLNNENLSMNRLMNLMNSVLLTMFHRQRCCFVRTSRQPLSLDP